MSDVQREYLRSHTVIFFREGTFYPIVLADGDDVARHAEMNPGTLRVEDIDGNVLWLPSPDNGGQTT